MLRFWNAYRLTVMPYAMMLMMPDQWNSSAARKAKYAEEKMTRGSTTLTCLVNLVTTLANRPLTSPILAPPEMIRI